MAMADRTEKLTITRTHTATTVRLNITEAGITVAYSVKTYESHVKGAVEQARKGADRMLAQVLGDIRAAA